ncbi:MAG: toll/interleukin-1 receptor domain-containing protein [Anaerolineales bacterium]
MDKPIIFFSHSSKDKEVLIKLKELIDERTGRAIDIFLSSDGQSIPLGRNWVKSVEDALLKASIMFVFISPNSYTSNWLNFEAGHVYSRGIQVVPVGILGLDLNHINPPLSLLQGFNCDKANSLDNIIAIINQYCKTTFKADFTEEEFNKIFNNARVISSILAISFLKINLKIIQPPEEDNLLIKTIEEQLKISGINFIYSGGTNPIHSNGLELSYTLPNRRVSIRVDKLVAGIYLPVFQELLVKKVLEPEDAQVIFATGFSLAIGYLRQSALLKDTDVQMKEGEEFMFQGIYFRINQFSASGYEGKYYIRMDIIFHDNFISNDWLEHLIQIFVNTHVIEVVEDN